MAAAWSGGDLSAQAEEDQAWAQAQAEEDQAWAQAQAEEDQAWAEAWEEMEEELELEQEAAPAFILLLPEEILHRVLGFLSHSTLVNTVFRVNVRLSRASAAEARTRTQTRLLDALIAGFGGAAEATRPRLSSLATQLETALASAGSARYQSKFRQLIFNLKDPKNPDLRARLLSGDIGTADLLRLTAQQVVHTTSPPRTPPNVPAPPPDPHSRACVRRQLAGSELQQQRSEWRRKGKLRAMRPHVSSGGYETDLYRCDNCGGRSTRVHRSIRAGRTHVDRATTWATCTNCRHRWEV